MSNNEPGRQSPDNGARIQRAIQESNKTMLTMTAAAQRHGFEFVRATTHAQLALFGALSGESPETTRRITETGYDIVDSTTERTETAATTAIESTAETSERLADAYSSAVRSQFDAFLAGYESETGTRPKVAGGGD